jgi:CheY-like chemotaxis protein
MNSRLRFPTVPIKDVPASLPVNDAKNRRAVVLVVDDESVIADTLSEILSRSGYTAIPAYDGEEALETALLMPPEMLISDVQLPGMNGIELAITVKRVFPDCKILLFSGQASTAELLASADRAGHRFTLLTKPVHPTELLRRISEGLSSPKANQFAGV